MLDYLLEGVLDIEFGEPLCTDFFNISTHFLAPPPPAVIDKPI